MWIVQVVRALLKAGSYLSGAPGEPRDIGTGEKMIKRLLPWDGLGHEVVAHGGVVYIGGIIAEDTTLDMAGQAEDVLRQLSKVLTEGGSSIARVLQVTIYLRTSPRSQTSTVSGRRISNRSTCPRAPPSASRTWGRA